MTTYSYTTLSDPSGSSTFPVSINNRGEVTGIYNSGTAEVSFLYSNGTWTTLSDPSVYPGGFTSARSINDRGQVVGDYEDDIAGNGIVHGFLYSNGTWTTLSDPSARPGGPTDPVSINNKGQVTGTYYSATAEEGFLYSNGTWTTLSDPSARPNPFDIEIPLTAPRSINNSGQVVGTYDNGTNDVGFLYSNGTWTTLSDPSAAAGPNGYTVPVSINDRGQVVGYYDNGTREEGFLYSNGTWTTLSDPSAMPGTATYPVSINNKGQVTGSYDNFGVGFVYSNGTWTTLSDPSAGANGSTSPLSINDRGQVVGNYYNGSAVAGFIANPTDVDHKREPPKLTITDHSLSLSAGGTIPLPISVSPNDTDDTVTVKISGVPRDDTITAGDGHVVSKKNGTYTFTAADVQSGLSLTSSLDNHAGHHGREGEHDKHRSESEQSKLTVTAFNTTAGEHAATKPQTITVTNTPNDLRAG